MWNDIKYLYFEMIKETIAVGELPDTARRAIISLIYKKGDCEQLSNYRPISLTNYDYKILAFTLSKRLQNVIGKIISNDQTGYIKKRFIGCNARLVNDIITFMNEQNRPGALLFLDFEKAFDSVEWNFIFKVLEKFNFGPYFSSLIRIFYNNPTFTIKNNGWLSEIQSMHRGVRQGCPVSAQIFILVVELLALNIKNAKDIKGIKLPGGMESKISQYADDSTLTLGDLESITNCIREIKSFCAVSGLKLNINKSVGIWLGTLRDRPLNYEGIQFTNDPVKCLGIYVGHNQAENYILNWTSKVKKIKDLLNSWKCRNLTIFGKCLVIKSLAISKLNLLFSVLTVPAAILKELQSLFYEFIWGKKDKIKRITLIGKPQTGGLSMVDLESYVMAAKAAWIPRLITMKGNWTAIPVHTFEDLGIRFIDILRSNITDTHKIPSSLKLSPFYIECIAAFNKCKRSNLNETEDLLSECIWLNDKFKFRNSYLYIKSWIDSGFIYLKDFLDYEGKLMSSTQIKEKLKDKRNWIAEIHKISTVIRPYLKVIKSSYAKYVNIPNNVILKTKHRAFVISDQKSKFFYDILIEKKSQRPSIEKFWERKFDIKLQKCEWQKIYCNKIYRIPERKIAQISYKLLFRIVPCNFWLKKCKLKESDLCDVCGQVETIEHLFFECDRVSTIWSLIETHFKIKIRLKHLILGYYNQMNNFTMLLNYLIAIVLFTIYKHWCINRENENHFTNCLLKKEIKTELILRSEMGKYSHASSSTYTLLANVASIL